MDVSVENPETPADMSDEDDERAILSGGVGGKRCLRTHVACRTDDRY